MKIIWLLLINCFMLATIAGAQEINFSRVEDMAVWYNQSLKTDKNNSLKLNFRNVRYEGAIAYNSISAMADIPLLTGPQKEKDESGYFSISVGAASDKSNQGILSNTLGLAGVSYAVPVGGNETYAAVGFQGVYYQSRLNTGVSTAFGDQYDQYGPIEGKPSADRLASGWSYNHFSANAGISLFSNAEYSKWYMGVSVMQLNRPYTDDEKTTDFRLREALGIQAGYTFLSADKDEMSANMSLNWQGNAYKHFFNLTYFKGIPSIEGGVGAGLGYRYDDALVPMLEVRYIKAILGISYDMNISGFSAAGLKRNGLELAVKLEF